MFIIDLSSLRTGIFKLELGFPYSGQIRRILPIYYQTQS